MKHQPTRNQCTLLALILAVAAAVPSRAEDLFQLFWRGVAYGKGAHGAIISSYVTEKTFVNQIAQANGLDPSTLVLVYRPNERDAVVVVAATGQWVAGFQTMQFQDTEVANAATSRIVHQAFLFDGNHSSAIGSFTGSEYPVRDSSGKLTSDYLSGVWQFAIPETNGVYCGNLSTGARVVDTTATQ